jgi:hypothetical protein
MPAARKRSAKAGSGAQRRGERRRFRVEGDAPIGGAADFRHDRAGAIAQIDIERGIDMITLRDHPRARVESVAGNALNNRTDSIEIGA